MASTRTDIHRPSAPEFDPETYTYRGAYYFGTSGSLGYGTPRDFDVEIDKLTSQGYRRGGSGTGGCGHCGANIMYGALMLHAASQEWILVGEQCLGNRFSGTKADFAALRAGVRRAHEQQRKQMLFEAVCERYPILAYASYASNIAQAGATYDAICGACGEYGCTTCWEGTPAYYYQEARDSSSFSRRTGKGWALTTLADLAGKAQHFGNPSEKQVAFAERLMAELDEAAAKLAERESAEAEIPPVRAGRQEIAGTIIAIKWVASDYSPNEVCKITIATDAGQRFYGTAPRVLFDDQTPLTGRAVTLTATVKPNPGDHTHGFYARPVKTRFTDDQN